MDFQLHTLPEFTGDFERFCMLYRIQELVISPESEMSFRPENGRRCRFCSRKFPDTTFKNIAHTIPQFLGNKHHVSENECDECNNTFSANESHLKNFLGVLPTLTRTKGKKGVTNFHSPNNKLMVRKSQDPLFKNGIEVSQKDEGGESLVIDFDKQKQGFNYTKNPYIPFSVYKALLKIALTIIPNEEVADYQKAFKILSASDSALYRPYIRVHKTDIGFNFRKPSPYAFLFRKRNPFLYFPTHHFILYYQNLIIQFPIPLNFNDGFINMKRATTHACPPFYANAFVLKNVIGGYLDLSSIEKKADDLEEWSLNVDMAEFLSKSRTVFDPKTGKWAQTDRLPGDIAKIILAPKDTILNLDPDKRTDSL